MAKKKAATKTAAARAGRTSAAADARSTDVIGKAKPREGATTGGRVSDLDITAPAPMQPAELVDGPAGPEPELTQLERKREQAYATGEAQPHPTMAPRAGRTSPDTGPLGRAHQPLQVLEGDDIPDGSIKVTATQLGEYAFKRRREGDTFFLVPRAGIASDPVLETSGPNKGEPQRDRNGRAITRQVRRILTPAEQFSSRWMVGADPDAPLRESNSGDVMPRGGKGAKSRTSDASVI